ncbi:MAG: hypothetical protein J6A88_02655 [Oscillospiraceae bacterium]|nr:hypothetical protein [Oscillospiraceae bacterium]
MKVNLRLKIKSRNQPQWLCWLLIILPFLFGTLIEWLGAPAFVKYILDVACLVLLLIMIRLKLRNPERRSKILVVWGILFFLYTLIGYLFLYQSLLYYLWGARNNFRYYVAFVAFCTFLEPEDVQDYFKLFDILFWVNVVVSLVQYFFLEKTGDYLGGIFGVEQGCNAYSNLFFVVVLTKSVVFYMERRERLAECFWKFVAVILVAALAELKFFFIEAVAIMIFASLFTSFSWRKVGVLLGGSVAIGAGAALLTVLFPYFGEFFSLEWFLNEATSDKGYTYAGDLNRMTVITEINERFLETTAQRLFGMGLGNCDNAAYEFLITPFFAQYSKLHYTWLSTAYIYLETGWVGLIFFFGFFVLAFSNARKIEKKCTGVARTYCRVAKVMAILCMMIAIYNASLRTEAGYMVYFVLALPNIVVKVPEGEKNPA